MILVGLLILAIMVMFIGLIPNRSWRQVPSRSPPLSDTIYINGPPLFVKCEKTGKWYDRDGNEIEVKEMTLNQLLEGHCNACGLKHEDKK